MEEAKKEAEEKLAKGLLQVNIDLISSKELAAQIIASLGETQALAVMHFLKVMLER